MLMRLPVVHSGPAFLLFWSFVSVVIVLLFGGAPAIGQAPQLEILPLDEGAPEVVAARTRAAAPASAPSAAASQIPPNLFLVGIGAPELLGAPGPVVPGAAAERQAIADAVSGTVFDPAKPLWIDQKYGPPLNVDLYCSWAVNPETRALLKNAEAEQLTQGAPQQPRSPGAPAVQPSDTGDDPDDLDRTVTYPFLMGGRPCVLRCTRNSNPSCSRGYLAAMASRTQILQLGN
jgi:hypothetical protein